MLTWIGKVTFIDIVNTGQTCVTSRVTLTGTRNVISYTFILTISRLDVAGYRDERMLI